MLGVIDKITKELDAQWGDKKLLEWLRSHSILQKKQELGDINGPKCSQLLKSLDLLKQALPTKLHDFLDLLDSFHQVRTSCFGNDLSKDYEIKIDYFEELWKTMEFSVPTKLHCLFR